MEAESGWQFRYPQAGSRPDVGMTLSDESGVPYVRLIRAPNPGPMTLDGTNTWVIADQGEGALVVDPGPAIVDHIEAILAAACHGSSRLCSRTGISITQKAQRYWPSELVAAYGPPIRNSALGPDGLDGGDQLRVGALTLEVIETPGHTSDSRSLLLSGPDGVGRLITGDMVLGRGTTVITYPDGDLGGIFRVTRSARADGEDPQSDRAASRSRADCHRPAAMAHPSIAATDTSASIRSAPLSRPGIARPVKSWPGCTPRSIAAYGQQPSSRCGRNWTICGNRGSALVPLGGRKSSGSSFLPHSVHIGFRAILEAMNQNQQPGIPDFTNHPQPARFGEESTVRPAERPLRQLQRS